MPKKKDTPEVEAETLEDEVSGEASEETSEETLEVEKETSEETPEEEVSDTPEAVAFPESLKIDGSKILSVKKDEYYNIKAANGCTYKLTEEEYKSL